MRTAATMAERWLTYHPVSASMVPPSTATDSRPAGDGGHTDNDAGLLLFPSHGDMN